jgi:hypothetical protein
MFPSQIREAIRFVIERVRACATLRMMQTH